MPTKFTRCNIPFPVLIFNPFPVLIFNPESKVTYGMVYWMINLDNVKQCDPLDLNNIHACTEPTKIVPVTTSLQLDLVFAFTYKYNSDKYNSHSSTFVILSYLDPSYLSI